MLNFHRYCISSDDESETEGPDEGAQEVAESGEKNVDEDVKSGAESEGGEWEGVDVKKLYKKWSKQQLGPEMEGYVSSVSNVILLHVS